MTKTEKQILLKLLLWKEKEMRENEQKAISERTKHHSRGYADGLRFAIDEIKRT